MVLTIQKDVLWMVYGYLMVIEVFVDYTEGVYLAASSVYLLNGI